MDYYRHSSCHVHSEGSSAGCFFSRIQLPNWALRFLNFVPVAVMAALVAQELLTYNNKMVPLVHNEKLLALIPTFVAAILTRSLLCTVVAGILSMMALRLAF